MRKLSMLGLTAIMLSACGSGDGPPTVAPPVAKDTVITFFTNRQQGFTNTDLPEAIGARVHLSTGEALAGVPVRFFKGSQVFAQLTSNADGLLSFSWKLGAEAGGQGLDVQVGNRAPMVNAVTAVATPRDSADVVIMHGLLPGNNWALVEMDRVSRTTSRGPWPDTVRLFLPKAGGALAEELVAFADAHPPLSFIAPWTSKPDTIHAYFTPPIAIPLTFWFVNDSQPSAFRMNNDVGSINALFGTSMMGVKAGAVTIRDVSRDNLQVTGCDGLPGDVPGQINVYYLRTFLSPVTLRARSCDRRRMIFSPAGSVTGFAHEVGHSFNWASSEIPTNLMDEDLTGALFTLGQIFMAHFGLSSSLNEVYQLNRPVLRSCNDITLRCMEPEFDGR